MADKLLTAPLGQLPRGLLDFFAVKSMGEYPQRLGNEVSPVMDLTRWYADQAATTGVAHASALGTLGASAGQITSADWTASTGAFDFARGGGATIVPQNEIWLVLEATSMWNITDAGGSADIAIIVSQSNSDTQTKFVLTDGPLLGWNTGAAGITRAGQRCMTRGPMFLLPGMEMRRQVFGQNTGAGTIDHLASVRIRRILA